MMRAMVLSIGDELVAGACVDTNAAWLCQSLTGLGVAVEEVRQVPDARDRISGVLREAAGMMDLVISAVCAVGRVLLMALKPPAMPSRCRSLKVAVNFPSTVMSPLKTRSQIYILRELLNFVRERHHF